MKKILLSVAILVAGLAHANTALLEACNSIDDKAKRLACLKELSDLKSPTVSNSAALERSITSLQAGLDVGTSYNNYQTAFMDLAKEVALFKRSATAEQSAAIDILEQSVDTYKDAGIFWEASIKFYARSDNGLAYFGGLPVKQVGLEYLVNKHGLPTKNADLLGFWTGVPTDLGRSVMWEKAKRLAEQGMGLLKDQPKKLSPETSSESKT